MSDLTIEQVAGWVTMTASKQDLLDINELLQKRYKVLVRRAAQRIAAELEIGTLVAFNDNVKPTYLRGQTARVVNFRQTKLTVELIHGPIGKFRSGKIITSPASLKIIAPPKKTETVEEAE